MPASNRRRSTDAALALRSEPEASKTSTSTPVWSAAVGLTTSFVSSPRDVLSVSAPNLVGSASSTRSVSFVWPSATNSRSFVTMAASVTFSAVFVDCRVIGHETAEAAASSVLPVTRAVPVIWLSPSSASSVTFTSSDVVPASV